ncbi:MAG: hypothetical protein L6R39_003857 [Caloplaca ligustica]|nr:MAG: hypothetical protein L6R39_003857 [Caloplaca ligustica]
MSGPPQNVGGIGTRRDSLPAAEVNDPESESPEMIAERGPCIAQSTENEAVDSPPNGGYGWVLALYLNGLRQREASPTA